MPLVEPTSEAQDEISPWTPQSKLDQQAAQGSTMDPPKCPTEEPDDDADGDVGAASDSASGEGESRESRAATDDKPYALAATPEWEDGVEQAQREQVSESENEDDEGKMPEHHNYQAPANSVESSKDEEVTFQVATEKAAPPSDNDDHAVGESSSTIELGKTSGTFVRDPEFFRDDGNCVVCVGNTLFKIHRGYLAPPQADNILTCLEEAEGVATLENPVHLEHVHISQLRAFLTLAYTDRKELCTLENIDVLQLIDAAMFASSFGLDIFCQWSKGALFELIESRKILASCASEVYLALILLHRRLPLPIVDIETKITTTWLGRLETRELINVEAMETGEFLHMNKFLGRVYYETLIQVDHDATQQTKLQGLGPLKSICEEFDPEHELPEPHRTRLLVGSRSLCMAWYRIISKVPQLPPPYCGSVPLAEDDPDLHKVAEKCDCPEAWKARWKWAVKETVRETGMGVDVLTRIRIFKRHLVKWFSEPTGGPGTLDEQRRVNRTQCSTALRAADGIVQEIEDQFLDGLELHFRLGSGTGWQERESEQEQSALE
ncbi:unnamed protein product [Mycena citricolor]|uniref:BTB domain-containing protein n=1 Tax=Mycena citricolor TaxID=2018698 RepID=A0AAD2H1C6_9AGAR|nr:unnamed protein product [Mycena citricolor]